MRNSPTTQLRYVRALTLIAGLLLLLLLLVGYSGAPFGHAESLRDFGDAPAFTLIDQSEQPVNSEELRGRVVIADFIYTNCTDICPFLSIQMQALQDRLHREQLLGDQVQLLSFTVDPARDMPTVLRRYAERFQADPRAWRFLTGPEHVVLPLVVTGFHLGIQALPPPQASPSPQGSHGHQEEPPTAYEVMHSGRFVLIDRQWRVRSYYDGRELDLDRVILAIRQLLR